MKVGIITFHTALNYGAVLQTYALFRTLMKMGVETKVIDYRAPFNEKRFAPKPISYYFNPREIYSIIFRNSYQRYNPEGFKNFIGKYISLKTNNGTGYGGLLKRLTAEGLVIDQKYFDFEDVSSVDGYQCKHLKVVEV